MSFKLGWLSLFFSAEIGKLSFAGHSHKSHTSVPGRDQTKVTPRFSSRKGNVSHKTRVSANGQTAELDPTALEHLVRDNASRDKTRQTRSGQCR